MPRKLRKGFRSIVVDSVAYQYTVSFPAGRPGLIIAYAGTRKLEIPLDSALIPVRPGVAPTWRGKHGDQWVGKYEAACLIRQHLNRSFSVCAKNP